MATRAQPETPPPVAPGGIPESEPVQGVPISRKAEEEGVRFDPTPYFRYWVALDRVILKGGRAYFNPVKVEVNPGVLNVPSSGDPTTVDGYQTNKLRRIPIPDDFEVMAWGRVHQGYVRRITTFDDRGKPLHHHHDVWTRYVQQGARRVRVFDHEGFHDFRMRVEEFLGYSPHEAVAEAERLRLQAVADAERRAGHVSAASARRAEEIERSLAPEPPKPTAERPRLTRVK